MSALLAGHAAPFVALVAIAAKLTFDRLRGSSRGHDARRRGQIAMDERIRARVEATIWPD